ncbi:Endomembrane protein 70 [Musa troglodytarum]|uniref:Endomembrane protein 70 n=1 Tax=Musa troglodytarum TaxID=320322 RepID=A0A9E7KY91_9LILI|nr:Endomembrane protein 70 [Musa troglodytarum]
MGFAVLGGYLTPFAITFWLKGDFCNMTIRDMERLLVRGSTSVFIFFYCIHYYHTGSDISMIYMNKHTSLLLLQPRDHSPIRRGGIGLHEEVNRLHEVVAITIYVLRRLDQGRIGAGAIGHRGGLQLFRAGIVHWLRGKAG